MRFTSLIAILFLASSIFAQTPVQDSAIVISAQTAELELANAPTSTAAQTIAVGVTVLSAASPTADPTLVSTAAQTLASGEIIVIGSSSVAPAPAATSASSQTVVAVTPVSVASSTNTPIAVPVVISSLTSAASSTSSSSSVSPTFSSSSSSSSSPSSSSAPTSSSSSLSSSTFFTLKSANSTSLIPSSTSSFSNVSTLPAITSPSSSSTAIVVSTRHRLTSGAKAGIGISAALGALLVLSFIAFFFYRLGQRNKSKLGSTAGPEIAELGAGKTTHPGVELSDGEPLPMEEKLELVRRRRAAELDGTTLSELIGGERAELEARRRAGKGVYELG